MGNILSIYVKRTIDFLQKSAEFAHKYIRVHVTYDHQEEHIENFKLALRIPGKSLICVSAGRSWFLGHAEGDGNRAISGIRARYERISCSRELRGSLGWFLVLFQTGLSSCDSAIYDSSGRRRGFPRTGSATLYRPLHRNLSITIASVAVDQR